jgi:hypothetical protein
VFVVEKGDTVRWELKAKGKGRLQLGASKARIRFRAFPRDREQPLLEGGLRPGNVFPARRGVITGTVSAKAPAGMYGYVIELVGPRKTTELKCFWKAAGKRRQPMLMAGGEKSGGPGRK